MRDYPLQKGILGQCPCCNKNVKEDQLFVEEDGITYHYSCYNVKKSQEAENIE